MSEVLRSPRMTGHCLTPCTDNPKASHERCPGGMRANPAKQFTPCPCSCHLDNSAEFECGECGRPMRLAPVIEAVTGEESYMHVDANGRALGEYCP